MPEINCETSAAFNGNEHGREKMPPANIIVVGISGIGKSTLINSVFGMKLAKTGTGEAVTNEIKEYTKPGMPVNLWDTVGFELNAEKTEKSISDIKKLIAEKSQSEDKFDRIHAIWFCINSRSNRYQDEEILFVKKLYSAGIPFIIVLTQCTDDEEIVNEFVERINELNNNNGFTDIEIVQTLAADSKTRAGVISAFGLDDLVDITLKKLPKYAMQGFIAAQIINRDLKRNECEDLIWNYIDEVQKGFWDKVPLINIFTTDHKVKKLFRDIGILFNAVLKEDDINEIIAELKGLDVENGFHALVNPFNSQYNKKLDKFFEMKKKAGLNVKAADLEHRERVARVLAYYGYIYLNSIEAVWKKETEDGVKEIEHWSEKIIAAFKENVKRLNKK